MIGPGESSTKPAIDLRMGGGCPPDMEPWLSAGISGLGVLIFRNRGIGIHTRNP